MISFPGPVLGSWLFSSWGGGEKLTAGIRRESVRSDSGTVLIGRCYLSIRLLYVIHITAELTIVRGRKIAYRRNSLCRVVI